MAPDGMIDIAAAMKPAHDVRAEIKGVLNRTAPAWPLDCLVAVNPYLGYADMGREEARARLAASHGARLVMDRAYYREAYEAGVLTRADIEAALAHASSIDAAGASLSVQTVLNALEGSAAPAPRTQRAPRTPLFTDAATRVWGRDWSARARDAVSRFAAAWFDRGQALFPMDKTPGFFEAFVREMRIDLSNGLWGGKRFRRAFAEPPADPMAACNLMMDGLPVPADARGAYFERIVADVGGWAAYARSADWPAPQERNETLEGLFAARMAWDWALMRLDTDGAVATARDALIEEAAAARDAAAERIDAILQDAFERGHRRRLFAMMGARGGARENAPAGAARPDLQAVFCIDVRSEVMRRALETVAPGTETYGFAGFFGAALLVTPTLGQAAEPSCPVLLSPNLSARQALDEEALKARRADRARSTAWRRFKSGAVASFSYVESAGFVALAALARKTFFGGAKKASSCGHDHHVALDDAGLSTQAKVDLAAGILAGMSLGAPFAPTVVIAAHGATSANNPHDAGLQCGACGGKEGSANARVVCALLNDKAVRVGLAGRGVDVPADTVFVPALHDTTTDEVALYLDDVAGALDPARVTDVKDAFARAGALARAERALRIHGAAGETLPARAHDWSQVRPEWGLAGCKAFIAAPRGRHVGARLKGECFLHSYDHRKDEGYGVLEVILTAPVVVASWINLQYFASVADAHVFGAGDKTLHNVTGGVGVIEGARGDLRIGLPLQSVHDGERFVHEPVRLNVMVEAPHEAIDGVLKKHPQVRALFDHGWIELFTLDETGAPALHYQGDFVWTPVAENAACAGVARAA